MMNLLQMSSLQWLYLQFWTPRSLECLNYTPKHNTTWLLWECIESVKRLPSSLVSWSLWVQLLLCCFLGCSCCTPALLCLQLIQYLSQLPSHSDLFWEKEKMCYLLFPGVPFLFWPFVYLCLHTAPFNQVISIAYYKLRGVQVAQASAP